MSYQIFQLPPQHPLSAAGRVLPGAKAYFYLTGTSTPADTYEDFDLETEHENPVEADAGGRFPAIYLDPEVTYKVTITDANDVLLYTIDPANPDTLQQELTSTVAGSDGASVVGFRRTESGSVAESVHDVLNRTVYIEQFGGAPGWANDNTAAMTAAINALVAMGGGTLRFATPGEWRMNYTLTASNIRIVFPGGNAEYDLNCVRPYSMLSGPLTIGDGSALPRYVKIENLHLSGTNDTTGDLVDGGDHYDEAAYSAPHGLRMIGGTVICFEDCVFYNGIRTFSLEPSTTPVTNLTLLNCKARNGIADSADARAFYAKREGSDIGYITDIRMFGTKFNGPSSGYMWELDGSVLGFAPNIFGGYSDCQPGHGVLIKGSAAFRPSGHDIDPGTTNVVIIETDQVLSDLTRVIFGYMTQGGQRVQFSGTALDSGTLQSATSNTATIRAAASFSNNELAGQVLRILTGTGAGYQYQIASNVGATDVVTISGTFVVTPNSSSTYDIVKTVLMPAEADHFLYKPRINRAYLGPVTFVSPVSDPYNEDVSWNYVGTGRGAQLLGSDLEVGTAGKGLRVKEGSNARMGQSTLVGGTVTVSNTSVTANTRIFVSRYSSGGTLGDLSTSIVVGTSFTIQSSSGTDTSVINWMLVEPA